MWAVWQVCVGKEGGGGSSVQGMCAGGGQCAGKEEDVVRKWSSIFQYYWDREMSCPVSIFSNAIMLGTEQASSPPTLEFNTHSTWETHPT